jgi:hypothetical protein
MLCQLMRVKTYFDNDLLGLSDILDVVNILLRSV